LEETPTVTLCRLRSTSNCRETI